MHTAIIRTTSWLRSTHSSGKIVVTSFRNLAKKVYLGEGIKSKSGPNRCTNQHVVANVIVQNTRSIPMNTRIAEGKEATVPQKKEPNLDEGLVGGRRGKEKGRRTRNEMQRERGKKREKGSESQNVTYSAGTVGFMVFLHGPSVTMIVGSPCSQSPWPGMSNSGMIRTPRAWAYWTSPFRSAGVYLV